MTTPIIVQIIDAVVASVTQHTITGIAADDPARADVVKLGHLYQENPTKQTGMSM